MSCRGILGGAPHCSCVMVDNSAKPVRAEHVGSLLRPDILFKKRQALGPFFIYSSPDLKETEDEAIKYVVKLQKDAGMQIITDGELRRRFFYDGVFENLDGMTKNPQRPISEFKVWSCRIAAVRIFCPVR
jgi:methionine synthase II (cobalamin-independent)